MKAYITGSVSISPQVSFETGDFPFSPVDYKDCRYLKCIEPSYRAFIDPMAGRRMSRIVKMGVTAARKCMLTAGIEMPDAIITGTGLGCIADTEKFLGSVILQEEKLLNPTPFIQSTHNTVASAIALAIRCHQYNSTYVHRGFSFENALLDGILHLQESRGERILVGAVDEITEHSYDITRRMGFWKRTPVSSLSLLESTSKGSLPGEGAAFFMLENTAGNRKCSGIKALDLFYRPPDHNFVQGRIAAFLEDAGLTPEDLGLVILGMNGDITYDGVYKSLREGLLQKTDCAFYKHLCGEYDTSMSFAMWLADRIIVTGSVPPYVELAPRSRKEINHILIYNQLRNKNHSMILLSAC